MLKTACLILAFIGNVHAVELIPYSLSPSSANASYVNVTGDTMTGGLVGTTLYETGAVTFGSSVTVTGNLGVANTGQYQNAATFASSVTILGNANIQGATALSTTTITNASMTITGTGASLTIRDAATALNLDATTNNTVIAMNLLELGAIKANVSYVPSGFVTSTRQRDMEFATAANGDITFWPGGTQYVQFGANGNVGIGTATPGSKLEVNGNVTATSSMTIINSQNGITEMLVSNPTSGSLGRAGYSAQMSVAGNDGVAVMQAISPGFTAVPYWADSGLYATGISTMILSAFASDGTISFQTGGVATSNERMKILANGNVGVGTTAPGAKLEVNGNITASSVTATGVSGFSGEGANITGVTVGASSSAVNNTSIASVTNIHLATATVTMRGNRPQLVLYDVDVVNGAGGSRTYTLTFSVNGTTVDTHAYTCSGGDSCHISDHHFATSTAGSRNFSIDIRSSNATGTQTVDDAKISAYEF
jgi:hypothetical protein